MARKRHTVERIIANPREAEVAQAQGESMASPSGSMPRRVAERIEAIIAAFRIEIDDSHRHGIASAVDRPR